jgi:hypothetical protein
MEDYIFLIIAIILSIFGAINKKKKTTDESHTQLTGKPQRTSNFFFDQLLGEEFSDPSEKIIRSPVQEEPDLRTMRVSDSDSGKQSGLYHLGFKSTLPEQKKRASQTFPSKVEVPDSEAESDETGSFSYLEDFSLRKAFIYSEILQRKY